MVDPPPPRNVGSSELSVNSPFSTAIFAENCGPVEVRGNHSPSIAAVFLASSGLALAFSMVFLISSKLT